MQSHFRPFYLRKKIFAVNAFFSDIDIWSLPNGESHYMFLYFGFFSIIQVTLYSMFVSGMAFHAKISDPSIGGTYMTLLNTLSNLGRCQL